MWSTNITMDLDCGVRGGILEELVFKLRPEGRVGISQAREGLNWGSSYGNGGIIKGI